MDQIASSNSQPESFGPEQTLALWAMCSLNLASFIRSWNNGEGSLIADWDHFHAATRFDEVLAEGIEALYEEADSLGLLTDFDTALQAHLIPVISSSFQLGLRKLCKQWAMKAALTNPFLCRAPAPFPDEQTWMDWCINNLDPPPFATPDGEGLLPFEKERMLLSKGLHDVRNLAFKRGWLSRRF
jgi:hypothetical protein